MNTPGMTGNGRGVPVEEVLPQTIFRPGTPRDHLGTGTGIHVPVKSPGGSQELAPDNQARNSLLRGLRFQGEHGSALLTQRWAPLQHTTASPRQLTQIVRAALVLTQFEHKYIR